MMKTVFLKKNLCYKRKRFIKNKYIHNYKKKEMK
jgi:hypothetical protein